MSVNDSTSSFNLIYTRYYHKAYAFVKSYVHDDMASEDIVSESLINLWQYMKEHPVQSIDAFLLTSLKNKALDYLKHLSKSGEVHSALTDYYQKELLFRISSLEECDPQMLYSQEILDIYKKTLEGLPSLTRRVFLMSRQKHLSNKEIAERLGISVKTVEYHITKTIKVMRVELKEYLPLLIFFLS